MRTIRLTAVWICRAWPILIILLLGSIHFAVLAAIPAKVDSVNKFVSTATPLVGSTIVLLSIHSNLRLFRNQTFLSVIASWLQDFPLYKKSAAISLASEMSVALRGSATISIAVVAGTVEERVAELERQIVETRKILNAQDAAVHRRIVEVKDNLEASINSKELMIKKIANNLEISTIGGYQPQIFGILLVFYIPIITGFLPALK